MLQMIFEVHEEQLIPRSPRELDGTVRTPDGIRTLTLSQAAERSGESEKILSRRWVEAWGKMLSVADLAAVLGQTPEVPLDRAADPIEQLRRRKHPDFSREDVAGMVEFCIRHKFDPEMGFVWLKSLPGPRPRVEYELKIEAIRSIAHRTGLYVGNEPIRHECAVDNPRQPLASTATVYRENKRGDRMPFYATVEWHERAPDDVDGTLWKTKPKTMLGKCATAAALREAFPEALGHLYAEGELDQAPVQRRSKGVPTSEQIAANGVEPTEDTPQTRFSFERALMDMGLNTPAHRAKVIGEFTELYPELARMDPPVKFYATVLFCVGSDPKKYGGDA
jgi:hypothetical protein